MLAKLMKYELKATSRYFLPLFGLIVALALINRLLQLFIDFTQSDATATIGVLMSSIAGMLFSAIMVVVLVITIQRFNKNLLQNEGYLSFTLPVTVESLILSKLFISSLWYCASIIVLVISLLIAFSSIIPFVDIANAFSTVFTTWFASGQNILIGVEIIIATVLGAFSSTLLIYTCLSLGMLVNNHRGLMAFGMYFGISTVMQFLVVFLVPLMIWINTLNWSPFALSQWYLLLMIGTSLVQCAVYFATTRYMLRHRLNLL